MPGVNWSSIRLLNKPINGYSVWTRFSGASDQHNSRKLFGRKSPWSGLWDKYSNARRKIIISSIDAHLLETLAITDPVTNMPPTLSPNNKKKIRPSSAASNLQTHPSYYTGLFESRYVARPTTAAVSADTPDGRVQRPATHSIAPRRGWKASKSGTEIPDSVKHPRRLTLGAVDGIADLDTISRPGVIQQSASQQLKSKVCNLMISFYNKQGSVHVRIITTSERLLIGVSFSR